MRKLGNITQRNCSALGIRKKQENIKQREGETELSEWNRKDIASGWWQYGSGSLNGRRVNRKVRRLSTSTVAALSVTTRLAFTQLRKGPSNK